MFIPITSSASSDAAKANNTMNQGRAFLAGCREIKDKIDVMRGASLPWSDVEARFGLPTGKGEDFASIIGDIVLYYDDPNTSRQTYGIRNALAGVGG